MSEERIERLLSLVRSGLTRQGALSEYYRLGLRGKELGEIMRYYFRRENSISK